MAQPTQHNLSSMYHWYLKLSEDHPDTVRLNKTIGKSSHEREIAALHFTEKSEHKDKPKIFMQCLLHSSECTPMAVDLYSAAWILTVCDGTWERDQL